MIRRMDTTSTNQIEDQKLIAVNTFWLLVSATLIGFSAFVFTANGILPVLYGFIYTALSGYYVGWLFSSPSVGGAAWQNEEH